MDQEQVLLGGLFVHGGKEDTTQDVLHRAGCCRGGVRVDEGESEGKGKKDWKRGD